MLKAGSFAQSLEQLSSEHTQGLTLHSLSEQLLPISDCCHSEDFVLKNELEFSLLPFVSSASHPVIVHP